MPEQMRTGIEVAYLYRSNTIFLIEKFCFGSSLALDNLFSGIACYFNRTLYLWSVGAVCSFCYNGFLRCDITSISF